ncbi:MAG: hypothetical protein ACRDND_03450, partial [Streptosporangiaceae bacterium]
MSDPDAFVPRCQGDHACQLPEVREMPCGSVIIEYDYIVVGAVTAAPEPVQPRGDERGAAQRVLTDARDLDRLESLQAARAWRPPAADLISGGRLQLGVSRGSPETVLRGAESFGYRPADGQ